MIYTIFYATNEAFRALSGGLAFAIKMHDEYPDEVPPPVSLRDLTVTHRPIVLMSVKYAANDLQAMEEIFIVMQGEKWSDPGSELQVPAQALIKATPDVSHTSMSCGDIIVTEVGQVYMVAAAGFDYLGMQGTDEMFIEGHQA